MVKHLLAALMIITGLTAKVRPETLKSGVDRRGFDRSVRVQDDLFLHVNGEWLKHTPIPEDKSNYGSFTILMDEALLNLRAIVEEASSSDNRPNSDAQKIGDFYQSFMNEELVEQTDWSPLAEWLSRIEQLMSHKDIITFFGQLQSLGVETPIGYFVDQDDKDSSRYLVAIVQSGTSLPDRDYYLKDDPKYVQAREALRQYIARLLNQIEVTGAERAAEDIVALERQLAEVQWERTELRNAEKRYNKYSVDSLVQQISDVPWRSFLAAAGTPNIDELNVMTPSFFEGLRTIYRETSVATWKQYLRYKLVDAFAPYLSPPFVDAHFQFHSKELAGVPQQKPRWKRAIEATSGAGAGDFGVLGDAVGKMYVERHFPLEAKQRMDQLVQNLLRAYDKSIGELTWMTDVTKQRAREKLAKMRTKIGYTTQWRDYSSLEIDPDDLAGNVMRSNAVEHQRMLDKLDGPVDREEWGMTPQTVNAYYNPGLNEIVFPAAILQPPFFDAEADDAVNYGGIGAVIGHEISHGFDDQGSKYDGDGNLENWWTDQDRRSFTMLTNRLVDQFSRYEPLPGKPINGELTLGENIADLSGMSVALKAYRLSLAEHTAPTLDGWTGDQRFFIGWSQIWRRKYREAEMIRRLLTDPHSPSRFRANGPVQNLDAFHDAFQVQEGDGMYLPDDERIRIW